MPPDLLLGQASFFRLRLRFLLGYDTFAIVAESLQNDVVDLNRPILLLVLRIVRVRIDLERRHILKRVDGILLPHPR